MRVLWFSHNPSLYKEQKGEENYLVGWIPSLERIFRNKKIDLAVAFHDEVDSLKKEVFDGAVYYRVPQFQKNGKFHKTIRKWRHEIEDEPFVTELYKEVIDDFKPDIVQIWGSEQAFGLIIPYLKVPHVMHIQGNLTVYYQKYFAGVSKRNLIRSAPILNAIRKDDFFYGHKKFFKRKNREQRIFKLCENIFGRTDWDKRISKSLSPRANYYYCNEIMRDPFYVNEWCSPKTKKFKLVSVFRGAIYKGMETIIEAALLLINVGFEFEWTIAGVDKEHNLWKVMQRMYPEINKINLINPVGLKTADELIDLYAKSNLFIHATHAENSCNGVQECMLLGMPVLTTSAGGLQTIIADNKTGYLIQDGDPWAMAGAIMDIKDHYEEAIGLGQNAKIVAHGRLDRIAIFNTVMDKYKDLINVGV